MRVSDAEEGSGFGEQLGGSFPTGSEEVVPSKKFKRIKREEVPQAFDLDLVNFESVTYLPGEIDRAILGAKKNRCMTFEGVVWSLGGDISVAPGDWLLLPLGGEDRWWLVYASSTQRQIVVSMGGGYLCLSKDSFLRLTLDVRRIPPWEKTPEERELAIGE